MKGIFVNSAKVDYAGMLVDGTKIIETRTRRMLDCLCGERVAIIRTGKGKPMVIGYVNIIVGLSMSPEWLNEHRYWTKIPKGDKYDSRQTNKICYMVSEPQKCEPYPLPENSIRHGRTWVEF